jgi:hypothetical protein
VKLPAAAKNALRDDLGVKPPDELITWISGLWYGEPGAGKTWLLGTCMDHPDMRPMLLIDCEGGVTTLRKRRDIDVVPVRHINELDHIYTKVSEDKAGYYKTIGLDGLSELQQIDMRDVMDVAYNKNPDRVDPFVPSPREWGKNGERMRYIMRKFRDLPSNFIVTSLMGTEKDNDSGRIIGYYPLLPGRQKGEIPGFFDMVGLLRAEEEANGSKIVRKLQTTKSKKVLAKDRYSVLPAVMDDPTMPEIWDLIHHG